MTRLDAPAALGDADRAEKEAPPLLRPGTYLEPFALRALGFVRKSRNLLELAATRFDAAGVPGHADQTRASSDSFPEEAMGSSNQVHGRIDQPIP